MRIFLPLALVALAAWCGTAAGKFTWLCHRCWFLDALCLCFGVLSSGGWRSCFSITSVELMMRRCGLPRPTTRGVLLLGLAKTHPKMRVELAFSAMACLLRTWWQVTAPVPHFRTSQLSEVVSNTFKVQLVGGHRHGYAGRRKLELVRVQEMLPSLGSSFLAVSGSRSASQTFFFRAHCRSSETGLPFARFQPAAGTPSHQHLPKMPLFHLLFVFGWMQNQLAWTPPAPIISAHSMGHH